MTEETRKKKNKKKLLRKQGKYMEENKHAKKKKREGLNSKSKESKSKKLKENKWIQKLEMVQEQNIPSLQPQSCKQSHNSLICTKYGLSACSGSEASQHSVWSLAPSQACVSTTTQVCHPWQALNMQPSQLKGCVNTVIKKVIHGP